MLDLVNTVAPRVPGGVVGQVDYLDGGPDQVLRWARRVSVVDESEAATVATVWAAAPQVAARTVQAIVELREAVYTLLVVRLGLMPEPTSGTTVTATTARASDATPKAPADWNEALLGRLTQAWAAAADRSVLLLDNCPARAVRVAAGAREPATLILDRLALAAVDLLRTMDLGRLKVCPIEEGGCGWLFLDRSRNRSRRWCAMADCGNRVKSRRLSQRRRQERRSTRTSVADQAASEVR